MIRHTLAGWSCTLATAALVLTGCGRSREAPPTGGPAAAVAHTATGVVSTGKDPCTLLTRAEAEKALGEPATGEGTHKGDSECVWTGAANDDDTVSLDVDEPAALKQVVIGNGGGGRVPTESVSGVGDEGIYATGLKILFVRKGTTGFTIQIATVAAVQANASEQANEVTLAHAVLGRL